MNMDMTVCRICSLERPGIFVFNHLGKEMKLQDKSFYLLGIKVLENDSLPKHICHECLSKLNLFYDFKKMAINAQAKITSTLVNEQPSNQPVQIIEEFILSDSGDEGDGLPNLINQSVQPVTSTTPNPDSNSAHTSFSAIHQFEGPTKKKELQKKVKTVCAVCGEWMSRTQLNKHEKTVHLKKKLSCSICNIAFKTHQLWALHAQKLHAS